MNEVLQYLRTHGERLDVEIAQAVGMSLINVRKHLSELAARGEIMSYQSTKFENGKKIEGIRCRIAGLIPPSAPGKNQRFS